MDLCKRLIEKIAGENFLKKVFPCTPFKNFCTKEIAKTTKDTVSLVGVDVLDDPRKRTITVCKTENKKHIWAICEPSEDKQISIRSNSTGRGDHRSSVFIRDNSSFSGATGYRQCVLVGEGLAPPDFATR